MPLRNLHTSLDDGAAAACAHIACYFWSRDYRVPWREILFHLKIQFNAALIESYGRWKRKGGPIWTAFSLSKDCVYGFSLQDY